MRDEVQLPPTTPDWQEAWRVTEGIIRLMRDECRKKDTPFAMVTLTRGIQVTPFRRKEDFLRQLGAKDLYYPERRLAELGRRGHPGAQPCARHGEAGRDGGRSIFTPTMTVSASDTGARRVIWRRGSSSLGWLLRVCRQRRRLRRAAERRP